MPRGVPKNGFRQPRTEPAQPGSELSDAAMADDDALDYDVQAEVEEVPETVEVPADFELTMELPQQGEALSAEQQEIKKLRDQLARERGKKDTEPEIEELANPGDGENILIHFLEDGLTVLGKVMYRGDELEFDPKSQAYRDTFDRLGRTWLTLRNDEFGQVDRWGKIMFRKGPWPGKTYRDGTFEALRGEREGSSVKPPSQEELDAAEKLRKKRAAPRLPSNV